jgi:uncharacterized phage-like protein YoqJ
VTGKNIFQIGNGQSETYYKTVDIKYAIYERVAEFAESGVTDFLCNAEYGFPLWACEILIALRDIREQHGLSSFRVHIIKPYEEQGWDWSDDVHERFSEVHEKADAVLLLHRHYRDDCHERSERFMIDNCDFLFCDDENHFAAQYAELHNKPFTVCGKLERI